MDRNNPFGGEPVQPRRVNPFGDDEGDQPEHVRIEQAARKIRGLRSQLGAEGLSVPATRDLIDEVAAALEAAARALRSAAEDRG